MIRPRRDQDLEPLTGLLRSVYVNDGYPSNWPKQPARWLSGHTLFGAWVIEHEGDLLGHVALTAPDPDRTWPEWHEALGLPPERLGVVRRLFVAPQARRSAIASELVSRASQEADARGVTAVLDVSEDNRGAVAFWRRNGWRTVGHAALPPGDEGRALRLLLFVAPA